MSENARARERLDFEAAAAAVEKKARLGKENTTLTQPRMEFSAGGTMEFTAGGVEVCLCCFIFFFGSSFDLTIVYGLSSYLYL